MKPRHITQHTTKRRGDAIDVMVEQSHILQALFTEWSTSVPPSEDPEQAVPTNWDRGTFGKLVLEHAAVWLAAREDIVRVLRNTRHEDMADRLDRSAAQVRHLIDRLHEASRGVQPIALAVSPGYAEIMDEFERTAGPQMREEIGLASEIARTLGDRRGQLRGGKYIRKHAPTHPGRRSKLKRVPAVKRLHTVYDRVRGMPWAESYPQANTNLAEQYEPKKG